MRRQFLAPKSVGAFLRNGSYPRAPAREALPCLLCDNIAEALYGVLCKECSDRSALTGQSNRYSVQSKRAARPVLLRVPEAEAEAGWTERLGKKRVLIVANDPGRRACLRAPRPKPDGRRACRAREPCAPGSRRHVCHY